MSRVLLLVVIPLCLLNFLACSEDNEYVTNVLPPTGSIYGQVTPADPGTEVSAWQATMIQSTEADAEGYFTITGLDPGLYKVVLESASGSRREIAGVSVNWGEGTSLGVVELLDLPAPFLGFGPGDEAEIDPSNAYVYLVSSRRLSITSLDASATLTPTVQGTWSEDPYGYPVYQYRFNPQEDLHTSTTYTVSVGPDLQYDSGESWGETFSFSFRTVSFGLRSFYWQGSPPVAPDFQGTLLTLYFNNTLDPSTIQSGISIAPPFEYNAEIYAYSGDRILISVVSGLVPDTDYEITIGSELKDVYESSFDPPKVLTFSTEPLMVESASFGSSGSIDPGDDLFATLRFNADVDVNALNLAASFSPEIEGQWFVYEYYSGDEYRFFPAGAPMLLPDQTYTFTIDGSTPLLGEATLGKDYTNQFQVEPVKVTGSSPSSGSTSVYPSTYIRLSFNVPMNQGATQGAFRLEAFDGTPVTGTFTWSNDDRYMDFRPSSLAGLTSYTMSLTTAAQSQSGYPLKTAWSGVFRTRQN